MPRLRTSPRTRARACVPARYACVRLCVPARARGCLRVRLRVCVCARARACVRLKICK